MGKTIDSIISWVNAEVPNKIDSTQIQRYIADLLGDGGEVYKFNTKLTYLSTQTVADQSEYDLPVGVEVRDIHWIGVSPTTYNSTDVLGTTTIFNEYKYYGLEDEKIGARYTNYTTQLSITPTPNNAYHLRVMYKPGYRGVGCESSDSTTIIDIDNVLIEFLQNKVAARVAKSGSFPRVDLANNYELEAESKLSNARMNYYNLRYRRQSKRNKSWRSWW